MQQVATFYVHDLHFGLHVSDVQEILKPQELTPVPLAPPVVAGLINLRGRIVAVLDMRKRLGLPERPQGGRWMNLIVRHEENSLVSLMVDRVGDVLTLGEDTLEGPPPNVSSIAQDLLAGIHKLDGSLLLLLDKTRALITA